MFTFIFILEYVCHVHNEFTCLSDKKCLPMANQCDERKDCADGSDEMNCRKYIKKRLTSILYFLTWFKEVGIRI